MNRITRSWITTVVAWAAVLFIGGAAIAGVGSSKATQDKVKAPKVEASETPEAEEVEAEEVETETEGEKADNHGQCVSSWVHQAKEGVGGGAPLTGKSFGGFVSEVARSDGTGEDCDQSELYADWLAKQEGASTAAAEKTRGKSEGKGRKAGHKPAEEPTGSGTEGS